MERALSVLSKIRIIKMKSTVLVRAERLPDHVNVRGMDAIHLASANTLGKIGQIIVTYDKNMAKAAKELGYTKKTWVHRPSQDSARNEHAELASQTVGIDEKFEINGKSAMYPGDPEAPTEFVMNCSCTLLFS